MAAEDEHTQTDRHSGANSRPRPATREAGRQREAGSPDQREGEADVGQEDAVLVHRLRQRDDARRRGQADREPCEPERDWPGAVASRRPPGDPRERAEDEGAGEQTRIEPRRDEPEIGVSGQSHG
jgi:hypothetical protein